MEALMKDSTMCNIEEGFSYPNQTILIPVAKSCSFLVRQKSLPYDTFAVRKRRPTDLLISFYADYCM